MKRIALVIPARWQSSRFPGKPLHLIAGKPLIQHVWERCRRVKSAETVIVATDDMRIAEAAFDFGAEVTITSDKHPTGTDRIAEVAAKLSGYSHVINVQGDEPMMDARLVDKVADSLLADPKLDMATAACPFLDDADAANPNNVKVVTALNGDALYFSRSLIPFDRDKGSPVKHFWHIGLYGYRRAFLLEFVRWKQTPLERAEKLEQLRALEHGATIRVIPTRHQSIGVDTPEDAARVEAELAGKKRQKS